MKIEWCSCNRMLLRTKQHIENGGSGKCDTCEKEHAQSFKDRLEEAQQKEE